MDDVEARLRRTLHDELDPITPERSRAAALPRRALRVRVGRATAAFAVLLAAVTTAALVAGPASDRDGRVPPAGPAETRGHFGVELGPAGTALVAVDVDQGQACLSTALDGAREGTLRRDDPGRDDPVVAWFFASRRTFLPQMCAPMTVSDAAGVLADPGLHYLEIAGEFGSAAAPLDVRETPSEDAPTVAEIVCGQDGAVALTPEVQPRRDGIHLRIYNYGGDRGEFYLVGADGGNEIGDLPADDVRTNVSTFGPGGLQVGCTGYAGSFSYDGPGSERHARITIVDPYDLWTEPDLECGDGRKRPKIPTGRPVPDSPGSREPFEALIRRFLPGVEDDDVVERPLYPESEFKIETRTVVRNGRRIARVYFFSDDSVWTLSPYVCPDSGIAERES